MTHETQQDFSDVDRAMMIFKELELHEVAYIDGRNAHGLSSSRVESKADPRIGPEIALAGSLSLGNNETELPTG